MDIIHSRCVGLDISKKDAKVCVRIAGQGRGKAQETVTTWGSTTNRILALREQALTGRFRDHHAFLARMHLGLIDQHTAAINELTARIEVVIEPFRGFRELICTIPGISTLVADVIAAETGADMSRFPTAGHLASWAGVCSGHHESAGRIKSTRTRPGNPYLKGALGTAAMAAGRSKDTYLGARYRRLSTRTGKSKAIVAIEHTLLVTIWNMAHTGELYNDLGADYYTRLRPDRTKKHAVRQSPEMAAGPLALCQQIDC